MRPVAHSAPELQRLREAFEACGAPRSAGWQDFAHLSRRCRELLHGEDLRGRSVLEIGAGGGFLAHYLALVAGASQVTALDEYQGHGAPEESQDAILALRARLGAEDRVSVETCDFLDYRPGRRFDYLIFVNSLHHIVETPRPLSHDAEPWQRALRTFELCRRSLERGGRLLIQELSCRNYCPLPRYRRRMRQVRWSDKQPAREWCQALRASGFASTRIRYRYPLNLPELEPLRPLLANRWVSLLTDSSYVIRAEPG